MTESLVGQLGYFGIALILVLGGLGLPIPEEAPIILAAILSKGGKMWWPLAFGACLIGVLIGDFVVYGLARYYGERVMSLPLTRKFLSPEREVQMQGYFHRHGFKILILGRFAVGFRTAAYLTAGILKLPVLRLFLTDLLAASLSTTLMFGLGYVFAHQIEQSLDRAKYILSAAAAAVGVWLLYRYYRARQRAGLPVGPRVLVERDAPLPPDDLHARSGEFRAASPKETAPPADGRSQGRHAEAGRDDVGPRPGKVVPEPAPVASPSAGDGSSGLLMPPEGAAPEVIEPGRARLAADRAFLEGKSG